MGSSINKRFANSKRIRGAPGRSRRNTRPLLAQTALISILILILYSATGADASAAWRWSVGAAPAANGDHGSAQDNKDSDKDSAEYAPLVERRLDVYDFTFKTPDGALFNLRDYAVSKRVVIVNFLAGWCKNSNRNGHVIERLYSKYRDRGLGVVAVMEYSDVRDVRIHVNRIGIDYPVVLETQNRNSRKGSVHYKYRRAAGDRRKWGTPFYIILDGQNLQPMTPGAKTALAAHVYTVAGEMNEAEAERFLDEKLGK